MSDRLGTRNFLAATVVCGLLAGCAGGTISRVGGPPNELPKDLPKEVQQELKDKFEVKDSTVLAPKSATTPPGVAAVKAKGKTKAKNKPVTAKVAQTAAPTPKATVYPSRRPAKDPIWIGEEHVFDITYFGMSAGDFTLSVLPHKAVGSRKVYHVRGTAVSSSVFNLFYRLNDSVESFFDYDGFFSHRFQLILDETKQSRDSLELNDSEKGQTFYWNRWNHKERGYVETKEFQPIQPFSQDSLSGLFYLRTVPLPTGAVISFPVVNEGKSWEAVVTVVRREIMDTPLGRVNTVVLKPETKYQGVLQKKGDSFLWMTDDDRRFIVRLEAKVRIGTVVARLKKVQPGTPPAP